MKVLPLRIFDETLRDGEQQAGLFLAPKVKRELAGLIARTGVDRIDLMPAIDEGERDLARSLLAEGLAGKLTAATMLGKEHVDQAKACGFGRVILFYAVSDRLLLLRDPVVRSDPALQRKTVDDRLPEGILERVREDMLVRLRECLDYAACPGMDLRVDFAAKDASRADPGFLARCVRELGPRVDHFLLCDTVGVLRPESTGPWVARLIEQGGNVRLGVHFHNDLGLAVENTIEAVLAGASIVSGTFRGIGERAGNVALEQVLDALRLRHGIEVEGINRSAVAKVLSRMDQLDLRPAAPRSPESLRHESGIHVHSLLQDPRSYGDPLRREPEIWFGRTSGASNFQYLCERILGETRPPEEYRRLADAIKRRSLREGRCYSPGTVAALLRNGSLGG